MRLLIKDGWLVDPVADREGNYDILVENGKILRVAERLEEPADRVLCAKGLCILPGLIDLHVHLREPGQEYKETIATGARAAAAGGFTGICPMPNTRPATDSPEKIRELLKKASEVSPVHIYPIGAITVDQKGERLADIRGMAQAGAVAVSEDGKSVGNTALYAEGMKEAKAAGIPVFAHCEDDSLVRGGVMNAGKRAQELGLPGITNAVEDIIAARDIFLAKETGVRLHLCHCSTEASVRMLELAKAENITVTAETGPHYIAMTDAEIPEDSGRYKMNPPLRAEQDRQALIRGLKEGTIDVIATDHAPHSAEEKEGSMRTAPFGIVGLETAVPLIVTELVKKGRLTLRQMAERLSAAPARILGIDRGTLQEQYAADITILDLNREYEIDPTKFLSKGRNTPFAGKRVSGAVCYTIVDGSIVYENRAEGENR